MPSDLCEKLIPIADMDRMQDVIQVLEVGYEAGLEVWQLLMNHPMGFGVMVGWVFAVLVRRWWWKTR